ncbi:MAG TPA: class I SAM-dependent methyltransferase [Streptosporangiaceae bacterium]|jgi:SAM-dependent methyltransferase
MTSTARYDEIADFYATGWADDLDDPATDGLLRLLGPVTGRRVLEVACGHGRVSRELARRGAQVTAVDISAGLLAKAQAAERDEPLGVRYLRADVTAPELLAGDSFDVVVCNFGLTDIDDLDGAVRNAARALRPGGIFVGSLLHPCFPGGDGVSGSWPADGSYRDEGWWRAPGRLSSLRRQVGASHRTLGTYLNTFRRHGLWLDEMAEPAPDPTWTAVAGEQAARCPVFLVVRCVKAEPADPPYTELSTAD